MLDLVLPAPPPSLVLPSSGQIVRLVLPKLHPAQALVVNDPHRIVVAAMGSKWGKTYGMSNWLIKKAWNTYQSVNWWCAPSYRQARIAQNLMLQLIPTQRRRLSRTEMVIELLRTNGTPHSRIEFRSADRPETLRGEGVHHAVADEGGFWKYDAWVSLWTTLSRTRGMLRLITTPKGRNYVYDEWIKGSTPEMRLQHPEYMSYRCPTHDNPYVPRESLEEFARNLPEKVYRQEILAEFLDESAGVFSNFRQVQANTWLNAPVKNGSYVMGIDWAKHENYTVFTIGDRTSKHIVHFERFTAMDWNSQIDRAVRVAKAWNNAHIIMDSTGVGDVPYDMVRAVYANCEGYQISNNAAKVPLIQKVQLAFERAELRIPQFNTNAITQQMQRELEMFGYVISPQGKFLYSAPEGYQDDIVMSLALCWWVLGAEPFVYRFKQIRGV